MNAALGKNSMESVFVLEYLHTQNDEECWKRIGIYSTHEKALEAINRVNSHPGFRLPKQGEL